MWATFLSCLPLTAGALTGRVELRNSRDPGVQKRRDFSGVVIWLEPAGGKSISRVAARRVQMVQKSKRFTPHILAIPLGTTVEFPNFDPIFHNAFSNFSGQPFDIGLYPPGQSPSVTFLRTGVVRVFCNIHPTMSAVIAVLPGPHFAVTGPDGSFAIRDIPSGEYRLRYFHERATVETLRALERTINMANGPVAVPPTEISESGFIQTPHKNKYGKDYPPVIEDQGAYTGVHK